MRTKKDVMSEMPPVLTVLFLQIKLNPVCKHFIALVSVPAFSNATCDTQ